MSVPTFPQIERRTPERSCKRGIGLAILRKYGFLAIVGVALLTLVPPYSTGAERKPALKKNELMTMVANAKTPADHRAIAAYYEREAHRLAESSRGHVEGTAIYKEKSATTGGRQLVIYQEMVKHCERLARLQAEQSKEAGALAKLHEDMAKAVE